MSGLRVHNHIGNFHQRSLTDLEAGTMDPEQSFGAVLRHDGKLDERSMAFIQAAVLYTTATGERRVRTMNLSFPITNHIGNLFKFSDFDTGMALLYKDGESHESAVGSRSLAHRSGHSSSHEKPQRRSAWPDGAMCTRHGHVPETCGSPDEYGPGK